MKKITNIKIDSEDQIGGEDRFENAHLNEKQKFADAQLEYRFDDLNFLDTVLERPSLNYSPYNFVHYFSDINKLSKDLEYIVNDINKPSFSKARDGYSDDEIFLRIKIFFEPNNNTYYVAELKGASARDKISHLISKKEYRSNDIKRYITNKKQK